MVFAPFRGPLQDEAGNLITNAVVAVRRVAPGYPMAIPLYADMDGAEGLDNPINVTDGELKFFAVGGWYRLVITAPGYSKTIEPVLIGTAQGADVDAYATAGFTWAPESTTTAPPTTGCIRFNNADVTAATQVYISHDTLGGSDAEAWLTGMEAGEQLLVSTGVGIEIAWTIAGRSNQTGYVDFTVNGYSGPAGPLAIGDAGFVTVAKSGKTGRAPGYAYKFDNATSGDPGTGHFGLNNATVASATAIRFSETDAESNAIAALLASWDDSTTTGARGTVILRKVGVPTTFAIFTITSAVTDSGSYDSFTVAHVASGGTFTDEDSFTVEFSRTGDIGVTGATGQSAGVNYTYSTTTTDSDPGNGIFRLNNATLASATAAYLDNNNSSSVAMTTWLDSLDDSTSTIKGYLIFSGVTQVGAIAIYAVTGSVVDGTGYRKLTLTHVSSGGTWTNGNTFSLIFVRTGDKGDTGATGATGSTGTNGVDGKFSGTEIIKTSAYTALAADVGKIIVLNKATADTLSFDPAATLGATWMAMVKNIGAGTWALDPSGAETIDGAATLSLASGESCVVTSNGTALRSLFRGVADDSITNAKLANMATSTIKGRVTGSTGDPEDLTAAQARSILGVREALTAGRTYYVRTDGSDSNNGLANTSGGAFLTLQKAMDVISTDIDLGAFDVVVQVGSGTYTTGFNLKSYRATSGQVIFRGDTTTPSNCLISTTNASGIGTQGGTHGVFTIEGFKVQTTTSGWGMIFSGQNLIVYLNAVDFGACVTRQLEAVYGAFVQFTGNFAVSGGSLIGFWATRRGTIFMSSRTITYSNSPAYGARNFNASEQGWIDAYGMTFTNGGTVTGKRYEVDGVAGIYTSGGGASYVPGNSAGSTANGGVYY